jgi:hypothetical protein
MGNAVASSQPSTADSVLASSDFSFYGVPYVVGMQSAYFGNQSADLFVAASELADGIGQLLDRMQLAAEKLGGNAYTSFELTTDHNAVRDGVQGVLLHAQGCVSRLDPSRW